MAITSGFYNALNHDRLYEAVQVGSIFDGIIEDGIYETIGQKFMVTASGNGLVVNVGTGRAWFNHTWTLNDAILPIEMDEAELVLDRIDAVVLEVDASLSGRTNAVKTVKGTPSSQPVKPTLINTEEVHQYPLAYVSIRAEQTLIEQSDIENAVGTSATPFVIGVLEMMDVDALVAQWQTQFENMMRDDQQDFTDWEVLVKAAYEAWFAGVQEQMEEDIAEFETWEQTTKTTFETWFQNLQDELDDNQAAHLQRQIGTLSFLTTTNKSDLVSAINEVNAKASASISEILIDYDPSSMEGATVTLTHTASAEGHTPETYTIVLDDSGEMEVDVANLGHWTITEDRFGTQVELEIHYFGYYHVNIGGDIFINVSYADDFAGKIIYCTNADQTKTYHKTAGVAGETVQFCVNDEGVWTIYSSIGIQRYEVKTPSTVHDNTYNVVLNTVPEGSTVLPTDDVQILLNCANIWDKSYTTLAELFNDSASLLAVTSDNNAVDYLVRSKTFTTRTGLIPIMTSYTQPIGKVSINSAYDLTTAHAYNAFDGNDSVYGMSLPDNVSSAESYLEYTFDTAVCVKKFYLLIRHDTPTHAALAATYKIQASNDESTWTDLYSGNLLADRGAFEVTENINNSANYKHYRIWFSNGLFTYTYQGSTRYYSYVNTLQFFATETAQQSVGFCDNSTAMTDIGADDYCANTLLDDNIWLNAICGSTYFESVLNVKVPTMTSDTTPSGECSSDASLYQTYYPYKAFDSNTSTAWYQIQSEVKSITYDFGTLIVPHMFSITNMYAASNFYGISKYQIKASTDNSTWVNLTEENNISNTPLYKVSGPLSNNIAYRYMKVTTTSSNNRNESGVSEIQFYCRASS